MAKRKYPEQDDFTSELITSLNKEHGNKIASVSYTHLTLPTKA